MVSNSNSRINFLCSYGGKILPRSSDGKLRYVGGHTRVLAVDSSISFSELMVKLVELCGSYVTLKCQLPNGDLETLIPIKSDEELRNVVEEYERQSLLSSKIKVVLSPPKSPKKAPLPSTAPNIPVSSSGSSYSSTDSVPQSRVRYFIPRSSSPRVLKPIVVNRNGYCCPGHVLDRNPRFLYSCPRCNNYCR